MPSVFPPVPYHKVPVSQPTTHQSVQKEVSTPKPCSFTPPVQNKSTPKTRNNTKKATPSNDSQQFPFSARILQYRLHCYGENFRARSADHLVAQQIFRFQTNHIYKHKGKKETVTSLIIGPNKQIWLRALSHKVGQLVQGSDHGVQSTVTIDFIFRP